METTRENGDAQLVLPLSAPAEPVDWRAQVPSVSQLTRRLRGHLEGTFSDVWVKGEISNFRKPVSGHAYFVLKDASAQIRAVFFRHQLSRVKFQVQDGMEVLVHGAVTVYEARGEYQILGDTMEPVGLGALQLAFEQLKARLQKEGLFAAARKRPLPFLPRRIGIVTSATGAAVRDILKVLHRRFPDRRVTLLPAAVQGERAPAEIVQAIQRAERWNRERESDPIDVLIVGRGGGSLEDLWCFNDEAVARAIHACSIPVVSAVGHEIDFTIADFVADVRAPTPSAAAEMVVPRKDELIYKVQGLEQRLAHAMRKRLEQIRLHLGHLSQRLVDPRQWLKKLREDFARLETRLFELMRQKCLLGRRHLESSVHRLNALSPLAVLSRGYSITRRQDGSIVRRAEEAAPGTRLVTRLAAGELLSEVLPSPGKER